ncbi:DNA-binding protein WhiA [Terrisporobacter sp.]|uniref:DNA-binding protein WhiA n=1 Tax=Terrisporobacter sp. TaxID=1965305 RepID=UPI0026066986|nr:DNA-binding protein WhiA [Terrisporobacter sp.]
MSFSTETKNELARVISDDLSCKKAELSGIVKLAGTIQIAGYKKINLKISTELNSVARKIFKILKSDFNINTTIVVNKNQMLKRNNSYILTIKSDMGSEQLMKELGLLENEDGFLPYNKVPSWVFEDDECKKAFIRGAFLGGGSVSDPEKNYHLEFVTSNEEFAESLMILINSLGLNSKIVCRKNSYVVYLKESEQISDLLSHIGGFQALLSLQNTKILKQMRNNVNRLVNCETANLSKTVNAAVRQVENIKLIQSKIGISKLPKNLQQIALLRVENEDLTLKELGELLNPPISKSGVNHRLKKIEEIANDLRSKEFDDDSNDED